ncbi:hypothetical protein BDR04DRAFT_1116464 [Suillus decipiens]|nr:hypothetical protein BDR04DRAFT_1116464 [Suillus decipiens]
MDAETRQKLSTLALYLQHLPEPSIPVDTTGTTYGFNHFTVDDEDIQDMGKIRALNRALEIQFGQRNNGPIIFKDSTEVVLLQKWVDDLIIAAVHAYTSAKVSLPQLEPNKHCSANSKKPGPAKLDSKVLANHVDPRYVDLPEPNTTRKSGAKTHPLLVEGSRRCYLLEKGQNRPLNPLETLPAGAKQILRCIASKGCNMNATVLGKRAASDLEMSDNLPLPGHRLPQLRTFSLNTLDVDAGRSPDDGIEWLNETRGLPTQLQISADDQGGEQADDQNADYSSKELYNLYRDSQPLAMKTDALSGPHQLQKTLYIAGNLGTRKLNSQRAKRGHEATDG